MRYLVLLLLTGCCMAPTKPAQDCIKIDEAESLLKVYPVAEPKKYNAAEATRVANERKDALVACNADKAKLKVLLSGAN